MSSRSALDPREAAGNPQGEDEFFRIDAVHASIGSPIPGGEAARWLLADGPQIDSEAELFDELCWRIAGSGVSLLRATLHIGTLHPQIRGRSLRWLRERRLVEEYSILHGLEGTRDYAESPIKDAVERGLPFRRSLGSGATGYPLLDKIGKAGGTDYLALPLNPANGRFPVVTWTTDRKGGFRDADIETLTQLNPALAAIIETRSARRISTNLLDTYLGRGAGRRILAGHIRRAEGEALRAVVMASDMRNFTGLSDRLPGGAVIELLDDYFDAVVPPIEKRRGEVLKFVGDGLLAIFPAEDGEDFAPASLYAIEAAVEGLERLDKASRVRKARELSEIRAGVGLHLGEVIYGNVGAADRLDFTVIGPAVNLASRIEGLTKRLLRPLLTSSAFAGICPRPLVSLGSHPVRGLLEPEEVFGLPE